MSALSHHEILELSAPFARAGRRVDLGSSDRLGGRIAFAPCVDGLGEAQSSETMVLERHGPSVYRLRRSFRRNDGLVASLEATGPSAAELLARISAIDARGQFVDSAHGQARPHAIAFSGQARTVSKGGPVVFVPQHVQARIGQPSAALLLEAAWSGAGPMGFRLSVPPTHPRAGLELPADLFAVLGWDWSVLRAHGGGWSGSVKLHARGPARALEAQRCLHRACSHLVDTLSQAPRAFDRRHLAARAGVLFRRSLPLLVWLLLLLEGVFAQQLLRAGESPMRMLVLTAPALLLGLFLWRSHEPRFELPRWPRCSRAATWPRWLSIEGAA